MTAGERSNSSGEGVSSLVSGSSRNDRNLKIDHVSNIILKINQQNDSKIKVHHNYDTI